MIAWLKGNFIYKTPAVIIIEVNGVGYEVQISLYTYSAISNKENGQLFTYLHITENAQVLYGFFDTKEKDLFLQLISVSGVGASTARMMLSGMKPEDIVKAILQNNPKQLETIKGVGRKTAERLIVELKDKLGKGFTMDPFTAGTLNSIQQDAINALIALGISKNAAEASIKKLSPAAVNESMKLEEIIKLALKNL